MSLTRLRPVMGWDEALRHAEGRMASPAAYEEAARLYEGDPVRETEALRATARERPSLTASLARAHARGGRDREGLLEAGRQFGGDISAELAAVEAGTHPLQRRRDVP